jgi:hypothetical protein
MPYFCYALAILALLYVLGLGFTMLILPESARRYSLIIAPWVGYCYVNLPCWYIFYYGGQINRHAGKLILVPPVLCLLWELYRKRRTKLGRDLLYPPTLGVLAIAAGGFVVLSIPAFWPSGHLTTISLGNNDIATYGAMARYLSEFSRHSTEGFVGQMALSPLPLEWATKDFYFGPASFVAFSGKLLGLMPHEELSTCVFLLSALGTAVTFMLLHDRLRMGASTALAGVAFAAFHPMIQYVAFEGFFPQVVGMGLMLLLIWTNMKLLDATTPRSDRPRLGLLLTLFTCGLLLNYPHMLPFVWLLVGLYAVILAVLERSLHGIRIGAVVNVVAILGTSLICPHRIAPFIAIFRVYAAAEAGWFIPWMSPDYLLGLMYKNPLLGVTTDWRIHLALSVAVGLAFVFSMYVAHRKGQRPLVASGLACVVVYAGCLALAVMGRHGEILGGYKAFKLVVFFLPLFGVTLIALLAMLKSRYRAIDLGIRSLLAVAVLGGYVMADKMMLRPTRFARVEPEYEVLRGLERTRSVTSINVLSDVYWPTLWTAYFLMHKKLYLAHQSYYATSELVGEYDLDDKARSSAEIIHVKSVVPPALTTLNNRFTLIGPVKRKVRGELGAGWYLGEPGHVWSGKEGKRSLVVLYSRDDDIPARLRMICYPLRDNDNLTVLLQGRPLSATVENGADGRREITVQELKLSKGTNELAIDSELPPTPPNGTDPRPVSYSFTSIEIEEL